jgi:PDZ domain-containing protein
MKNRLFPLSGLLCLLFLSLPALGQKPEMFAKLKGGKAALADKQAVIPFSILGSHYLFVDVRLNDTPQTLQFIFDSGGVTMLDTALAQNYNLTVSPLNAETSLTTLDRLDLAGVTITEFRPFVSDFADKFKAQGKRAGINLTGMLGCDALRFFRLTIDYQKKNLILTPNNPPLTAASDNQALLPMEILLPYHACLPVDFPGFSLPGRIDTGLHYAVVLPLAQMEKLSPGEKARCLKSKGNFAKWPDTTIEHNFLYVFPEVRIGRFVLKDQPVLFADLPAPMGTDFLLLGKHFLENYVTTMDFSSRQVLLERVSEDKDLSLTFSAGLHLASEEGRIKVVGLWENSPADRAGLQVGQQVLQINGKAAAEMDNAGILHVLMSRGIEEVELEVEVDGKPRQVVLKKEELF